MAPREASSSRPLVEIDAIALQDILRGDNAIHPEYISVLCPRLEAQPSPDHWRRLTDSGLAPLCEFASSRKAIDIPLGENTGFERHPSKPGMARIWSLGGEAIANFSNRMPYRHVLNGFVASIDKSPTRKVDPLDVMSRSLLAAGGEACRCYPASYATFSYTRLHGCITNGLKKFCNCPSHLVVQCPAGLHRSAECDHHVQSLTLRKPRFGMRELNWPAL